MRKLCIGFLVLGLFSFQQTRGASKLLIEFAGSNSSFTNVQDFTNKITSYSNSTNLTFALSDVDECKSEGLNTCSRNANCTNLQGSFTCDCHAGYYDETPSFPGRNCSDLDECQSSPCTGNTTCSNTIGSFLCPCKAGYTNVTQIGFHTQCEDQDECTSENNCSSDAICSNTAGSYICECKPGFVGDGYNCTETAHAQTSKDRTVLERKKVTTAATTTESSTMAEKITSQGTSQAPKLTTILVTSHRRTTLPVIDTTAQKDTTIPSTEGATLTKIEKQTTAEISTPSIAETSSFSTIPSDAVSATEKVTSSSTTNMTTLELDVAVSETTPTIPATATDPRIPETTTTARTTTTSTTTRTTTTSTTRTTAPTTTDAINSTQRPAKPNITSPTSSIGPVDPEQSSTDSLSTTPNFTSIAPEPSPESTPIISTTSVPDVAVITSSSSSTSSAPVTTVGQHTTNEATTIPIETSRPTTSQAKTDEESFDEDVEELRNLVQGNLTADVGPMIVKELQNLLKSRVPISTETANMLVDIVNTFSDTVEENIDPQVGSNFTSFVSAMLESLVLNVSQPYVRSTSTMSLEAVRLRGKDFQTMGLVFEVMGEKFVDLPGNIVSTNQEVILWGRVTDATKMTCIVIFYARRVKVHCDASCLKNISFQLDWSMITKSTGDARIFMYLCHVNALIHLISPLQSSNATRQFAFTRYIDARLFNQRGVTAIRAEEGNMTLREVVTDEEIVNSPVIAASIKDKVIQNSPNPVTVTLPLLLTPVEDEFSNGTKRNYRLVDKKCAWWNYTANNGSGGWSEFGCTISESPNNSIICECNHLTSFAAIMRISVSVDDHTLTILSVVGCAISIVGLLLTIITYSVFKTLRKNKSKKILIHFCVALCGVYVSYLLGIVTKLPKNQEQCVAAGFFLHYFMMAVIAWMLVEVMDMYFIFVKIWGTVQHHLMKAVITGWFIPLLIALITFGVHFAVDTENNKDQRIYPLFTEDAVCWLGTYGVVFAFLVPSCLVLTTNLILFSMVVYSITCKRAITKVAHVKASKKRVKATRHIINAFALLLLVGPTWIVGYLVNISPGPDEVLNRIFSYVFVILNAFQGLWIFIMFSVRPRIVRRLWRDALFKRELVISSPSHSLSHGRHTHSTTTGRTTKASSASSSATPTKRENTRKSTLGPCVKNPVTGKMSSGSSRSGQSSTASSSALLKVPRRGNLAAFHEKYMESYDRPSSATDTEKSLEVEVTIESPDIRSLVAESDLEYTDGGNEDGRDLRDPESGSLTPQSISKNLIKA